MNSSGNHLSKEMLDLIKSIGDSRSKQEEDKIISKEQDLLKIKIKESNISNKKMKEYLLRAIYIEMLGHDAEFAQFSAVNLTQDSNLLTKRVGYLACSLLLYENSPSLIMLVSTLQKDILNSHFLVKCMALITCIKFANSTIVQAVLDQVVKLLDDKSEHVRKKAVMCLHRFYQVSPSSLSDIIDDKMRKMLCDFDPSVMGATLNYFQEYTYKKPEQYEDLVSSFVVILKQVIEHKLPRDFDYHRLPAPWIQIKILQILANLGRDSHKTSEGMYEMLSQVLRRADDTGINIGYAIVYQCVRTICIIYPNQHLLEQASSTISRFLSSQSPNLRCTGINGLALIIQINPDYVTNHQQVIVDCLEENDETLKKNTFDLLYKMTSTSNVEVIVDKMIQYLKVTEIEGSGRKSILFKITELAELYAPNKKWFIKIMNKLFVNFGSLITEEIVSKMIKIIGEWAEETEETEFKEYTIFNYTEIIKTVNFLPDPLVQLVAFIFGEYSLKLSNYDEEEINNNFKLLEYLLLNKSFDHEKTKGMIITAMTKMHLELEFNGFSYVKEVIEKCSLSRNVDIQQKSLEYLRMYNHKLIGAKEFICSNKTKELEVDSKLSFLDSYVRKRVSEGSKVYNRTKYENESNNSYNSGLTPKQLNLGPYPENNKKDITINNKLNNNLNSSSNKSKIDLWTSSGLKEDVPKINNNNNNTLAKCNNYSAVASSENKKTDKNSSINTKVKANTNNTYGNNRITSIKGDFNPKDKSNKNLDNKFFDKQTVEATKQVKIDPKKEELKNKLFNNLSNKTTTNTNKLNNPVVNNNNKENITNNTTKTKKLSNEKVETVSNNLLDIKQNTPNKENVSSNIFDIFGSLDNNHDNNNNNNTNTNNIDNKPANNYSNAIPDDIFNINNTTLNNNTTTQVSSNSNDIMGLFGDSNNYTENTINSIECITPYNIDTDKFGELWEDCPNEEESYSINKNYSTNSFNSSITNLGLKLVEVINNEIICAGKLNDKIVLVHSTIEDNELSLLIKTFDKADCNKVWEILKSKL